jgi:hypothetical protein
MGTIEWFIISNIYSIAECNYITNRSIVFIRSFSTTVTENVIKVSLTSWSTVMGGIEFKLQEGRDPLLWTLRSDETKSESHPLVILLLCVICATNSDDSMSSSSFSLWKESSVDYCPVALPHDNCHVISMFRRNWVNSFCTFSCEHQLFVVQHNSAALPVHVKYLFWIIFQLKICQYLVQFLEVISNKKIVHILFSVWVHTFYFPETDVLISTGEIFKPITTS